jgi:ribonucleotide reductase alpha subunit
MSSWLSFHLPDDFVEKYSSRKPSFGFGMLGELAFFRTYSRIKKNGKKESFCDVIRRCVEGCYSLQKDHIVHNNLGWDEKKAVASAKKMFDHMFNMRFLPPGRGLWMMGTQYSHTRTPLGNFNCAFVSTEHLDHDFSKPFTFQMDVSMLGVGCGFDVLGAGKLRLNRPKSFPLSLHHVGDSREGWVESTGALIDSYLKADKTEVQFDYSHVRPEGATINGFGGTASGPAPLRQLHVKIRGLFERRLQEGREVVDSMLITDIMNFIGECVVAGNIRRSSQIAIGSPDDEVFLNMKNYSMFPERSGHGRFSNNSVVCSVGMNYSKVAAMTVVNGEPGYIWLDNVRKYGRMIDPPNFRDSNAKGSNPCFTSDCRLLVQMQTGEQLEKTFGELCVETVEKRKVLVVTPKGIVDGKVVKTGTKPTIWLCFINKEENIKCTSDHVFMLSDGTECQASELSGKRLRCWKDPETDFDELEIKLGFIQGDGGIGRLSQNNRHRGFEINVGKNDEDIRKLFGFDGRCKTFYTTEFFDICKERGFCSKSLPERILPKEIKCRRSFLRGLFSANGSVVNKTRITLKSTCREMLSEVSKMLKEFGIDTFVTTNKRKKVMFSNGEYECKESYDLNIHKIKSLSLFYEKIGFVHEYKTRELERTLIKRAPKVLAIKDAGINEVFDFSAGKIQWGFVNGKMAHNCCEQSLESYEVCNLVEIFPPNIDDEEQFLEVVKYAYLYGKSVTLVRTHIDLTNRVQMRNRRIGLSLSGLAMFKEKHGINKLISWMNKGYARVQYYDEIYSKWLAVPNSIKTTSVKPSGTISLVAGVTAGIHYPQGQYFMKNIRLAVNSPYTTWAKECGIKVEPEIKYRTKVDENGRKTLKRTFSTSHIDLMGEIVAVTKKLSKTELPENDDVVCVKKFKQDFLKKFLCENDRKFFVLPNEEKPERIFPVESLESILASPEMEFEEQEQYPSTDTVVASIPVKFPYAIRSRYEVGIWEQMKFVEIAQKYWSDNQVSVTVNFDPDKPHEVEQVLQMFDRDIKNVSFLPNFCGYFPQMPEETIDRKTYEKYVASLKKIPIEGYTREEAIGVSGCTNESCSI